MLTFEQTQIVEAALADKSNGEPVFPVIKSNAIAGSGKTTLLFELTNKLRIQRRKKAGTFKARYITYLKRLADEAEEKFTAHDVDASTIHSFAYRFTVVPHTLKVSRYGDINKEYFKSLTTDSDRIKLLISFIDNFFISKYLSFDSFISETVRQGVISESEQKKCKEIINGMKDGELECNHGFYLKMFHLLVYKDVIPEIRNYDLLMLDEAGDINPVTKEIFLLLSARTKVLVGDKEQNVYGFNGTINGFDEIAEGESFQLSQSFRVCHEIGIHVDIFSKLFLDEEMTFRGQEYKTPPKNRSLAYISRTNAALVGEIIKLNKTNTPYNLTRKPGELFALPLSLIFMGGERYDWEKSSHPQFKDDVKKWRKKNKNSMNSKQSLISYLMGEYDNDPAIKSACRIILEYGSDAIIEANRKAKNHAVNGTEHYITLTTGHSSKGLEYDRVHILDDVNEKINNVKKDIESRFREMNSMRDDDDSLTEFNKDKDYLKYMTKQEKEELRLYYVICTRALYSLTNATHLSPEYTIGHTTAETRMEF